MPTIVSKPLSFFKEDPSQPRKSFDLEELRLLAASLVKKQLVPIIARPDGTMIDGHRRLRAGMLEGRPTHLDTILVEGNVTEAQIREIQLVTALHREDLKPFEVYSGCKNWLALHPGATARELAAAISKSEGYVSKVLSLDRCCQAVKDASAAPGSKIGISDWPSLAPLPEAEQLVLLAARLNGASRDELRHKSQQARNGDTPRETTSRIKVEVASGVTVTFTSKTPFDLDQAIKAAADAAKLMKEGQVKGLSLKNINKRGGDQTKAS
jgi:ParB/RepB/Spo0J family partition protein